MLCPNSAAAQSLWCCPLLVALHRHISSLVGPLLQTSMSRHACQHTQRASQPNGPCLIIPSRDTEKRTFFFSSCNSAVLCPGLLGCAEHCDYHKVTIHRVWKKRPGGRKKADFCCLYSTSALASGVVCCRKTYICIQKEVPTRRVM